MSDFDILIDSDAFVGLFVERDIHHQTVKSAIQEFASRKCNLVTTSFVVAETATVISRYAGQELACRFLSHIRSGIIPTIFIDQTLQQAAEAIFMAQANKNTSMVDCSNVAVMQRYRIPKIWSFDKFYFKKYQLQAAA